MRKKAKREEDELTRLEQEVRELKAINRSLTKQLKKLAKGIHKEEIEEALEKLEDPREQEDKEDRLPPCPGCGRNGLRETILAGRRFRSCTICDYKSGRIK